MTLSYTIRLILSILLYGKEKKKIYENHTSSCYPEKEGPLSTGPDVIIQILENRFLRRRV